MAYLATAYDAAGCYDGIGVLVGVGYGGSGVAGD